MVGPDGLPPRPPTYPNSSSSTGPNGGVVPGANVYAINGTILLNMDSNQIVDLNPVTSFQNVSLNSYTLASFTTQLKSELASISGIATSRIPIWSISSGSVIVALSLLPSARSTDVEPQVGWARLYSAFNRSTASSTPSTSPLATNPANYPLLTTTPTSSAQAAPNAQWAITTYCSTDGTYGFACVNKTQPIVTSSSSTGTNIGESESKSDSYFDKSSNVVWVVVVIVLGVLLLVFMCLYCKKKKETQERKRAEATFSSVASDDSSQVGNMSQQAAMQEGGSPYPPHDPYGYYSQPNPYGGPNPRSPSYGGYYGGGGNPYQGGVEMGHYGGYHSQQPQHIDSMASRMFGAPAPPQRREQVE